MIEFRDGKLAAMVWGDGQGNWGTGGWRPLSSEGLMEVDMSYLQNAPAAASFTEILDVITSKRREMAPEAAPEPEPSRRWWQFWR